MDNSTVQRIQDALSKSKSVAIALGSNPSIDNMGAALGLYLSLLQMGKSVSVLSVTEPIVELSNLVGIDKVKTTYEGDGADLVVSFPYREGEIEKVSYTIENEYLNIVVKAGAQGLNFSERDVKYTRGSGSSQLNLLFVLGTSRLSDIQSLFPPDSLKNVTLVNIDNRPENQGFGDIVSVSAQNSSVSEVVTQLLSDLQTPVDLDIAQNLLDGIIFATDNFQNPKTSSLAFEMSGILMRQGALRKNILADTRPQREYMQHIQPAPQNSQPQKRTHYQPNDRRSQGQYDQRKQPQRPQQNNTAGVQRPVNSQQNIQYRPQAQHDYPQARSNSLPQNENIDEQNTEDLNPPTDWLTPKVYKGSSNV